MRSRYAAFDTSRIQQILRDVKSKGPGPASRIRSRRKEIELQKLSD